MANHELIGRFLEHLRVERGRAALTVKAYEADLAQWEAFMRRDSTDGAFEPLLYTTADLRLWLAHLTAELHSAPRTVMRKASALKAFYGFLLRTGAVKANPASDLQPLKADKPLPVFVRTAEINSLLDASAEEVADGSIDDDFLTVRDHLIMLILYSTGLRSSELIRLLDANVDTSACELKVRGKRNKDRLVPFGPEVAQAIEHYRRVRRSQVDESAAELLVMPSGLPMYRKALYNVVHEALERAGVHAARLSPHVLRHTFATDMLNGGADLNAVSRVLGHSSLASTQVYTHITYRELKRNYQSAHPRATLKKGENHGSKD